MNLWLSPHNDDEVLFGSFTLLRHRPHVVVCFRSQRQEDLYDILAYTREQETGRALRVLGMESWEQLEILDTDQRRRAYLMASLKRLDVRHAPEIVWAPEYETGGHDDHNIVSDIATQVFGTRVRYYLTYVRGKGRTIGTEVPHDPGWVPLKLRALAEYASQATHPSTCYWFVDDTLREYVP